MSKNTHLEHLEDDILNNGSEGGKASIAFLRSLGRMLSQGDSSSMKVTTKWDGAPAVICGIDPDSGMFFVGNKSVFAKTAPKVCYTDEIIDGKNSLVWAEAENRLYAHQSILLWCLKKI